MTSNSNYNSELNDVLLIRQRHVKLDQRTRRQMERLCEDKISRYKFEEVHCSLPSSVKSTFIMTFSPDGQRVASTHGDHRIYICDLNSGKLLDTLEGHPKTPWCLAWHPSNREILASGCLGGEVRVWDLKSKACESWTLENHSIITSLDFHPRDRILVIASANDIHFWDWSESEPFAKRATLHEKEKVKYVAYDSSGTKLITGISNLPKYAGYSSESLQNRIIDGYLPQVTIEPIPTENMTQNSEIARSLINGALDTNQENIVGRQRRRAADISPSNNTSSPSSSASVEIVGHGNGASRMMSAPLNVLDVSLERDTMLLSRIAHLYRQLESLEDSMRNTSFSPYMNLQSANTSATTVTTSSTNAQGIRNCQQISGIEVKQLPGLCSSADSSASGSQYPSGRPVEGSSGGNGEGSPSSTTPASNSFEPYLVTFDESLEQLQLPPLIIDGQDISLATVIDQYPVDLSRQVYHAMQVDSINQVSQNFIRISKLMSSARLYRQVVQQILANRAGNVPYQPNQILTAQSVNARTPRNPPNIPIVLRNFTMNEAPLEANNNPLARPIRTHDPILAIEFRNSARNVPLSSICKIELIAARAMCILRSQVLVEQALTRPRLEATIGGHDGQANGDPGVSNVVFSSSDEQSRADSGPASSNSEARITSIHPLIKQLHATLMDINHMPLTTSNAYTHITSLRVQTEELLAALSSLLGSPSEGPRLSDLMHKIAFSLTGRRWSVPLGATINEIRLDVIHTLCIVDLTLHLTRQVQLLQMQRISIVARIDESRRPGSTTNAESSVEQNPPRSHENNPPSQPSTSIERSSGSSSGAKRKVSESSTDESKRQKTSESRGGDAPMEFEETRDRPTRAHLDSIGAHVIGAQPSDANQPSPIGQGASPERMVLFNTPYNHPIDPSLQRLVVATSSGMPNSTILVRVYNRLPNGAMPGSSYMQPGGGIFEAAHIEQRSTGAVGGQLESRRRALSQDNSLSPQEPTDTSTSAETPQATRGRSGVRPPPAIQILPPGSNYHNPVIGGAPIDAWQRLPHVHVYQTRGSGHHLWFNHLTIPLPYSNSNFRLQCWNFSRDSVPDIKDTQSNMITQKCRIHNDASVDISASGSLVACLVPRNDSCSFPCLDLKVFSLRSCDFGVCYYKLSQGPNAVSVSLSPSASYAIVGLASHKVLGNDQAEESVTVARVFKMGQGVEHVRDVKIKRDDAWFNLNAIKWLPRGIVYNVGPHHHQRYYTSRVRNVVAS